jgi:hypothetical protein
MAQAKNIDANGVLNVSAKDKGTGKENKITISGSSGLSDDEIAKMVAEAEANKETDAKKKALIETRNQADAMLHSTRKTLEENENAISEDEKKAIIDAAADLEELLKDDNATKEQIEENLANVANYAFPYQDLEGKPIMQKKAGVKEKDLYKLAIGVPSHKTYDQFVYESQKYNEFSSPLFMWLLDQKDFSVSPERLFEKAMEIYGDPIVALGVIPWIFSGDALTVDRGTSSVVSYKIERLVDGDDIPGFQYHFWGYLTQGIIGNRLRVGAVQPSR